MRKLVFIPLFVYSFLAFGCKKDAIETPNPIDLRSTILYTNTAIPSDTIYNWFVRSMVKYEKPPFESNINFVYFDFDSQKIRKNMPLRCAIRKIRKKIKSTKMDVFYILDFEDKQGTIKRINVYDKKTEMPVCGIFFEFEDVLCKKIKRLTVIMPNYLRKTERTKLRTIKK